MTARRRKTTMGGIGTSLLSSAVAVTLASTLVAAGARAIDDEAPRVAGPVPPPHMAMETTAPARETPSASKEPAEQETPLPDWSALNVLGGHYSGRFRSDDLPINGGAGTRVGRGEVAYSIPVAGPLYLRSGVLLDYIDESAVQPSANPADDAGRTELGGTPTVGFEIRF